MKPVKNYWVIRCLNCNQPLIKPKYKLSKGSILHAIDCIPLKHLKGELSDGSTITCKCGGYSNQGLAISEFRWRLLE